MELGPCLNSCVPAKHQRLLGLCRLKLPALLPESSHHSGQDAVLVTHPGLTQTGYH